MAKPSLIFFLREDRKSTKNGKIPVYFRILINREKADARLPFDIDSDLVSNWDDTFMRFRDQNSGHNRILNKYQKIFDDYIYINAEKLYQLSAKGIRNELMGKNEASQLQVMDALDLYFKNKIEKSTKVTHGTILNYKKSINHLRNFWTSKQ
ncbi:MAG: hypothetical protein L6Q66_05175 [Bacteroidia bacterium]|nr:hypothetical protein [Bacteroidia bacterium]